MIVKMKSYYLKKSIEPKELEHYGFKKCGDNYTKVLKNLGFDILYYSGTRRFVYVDYP